MKYLIYLRVSTDNQDVGTQERMCIEKIQSLHPAGDYAYDVYSDPGMSSGVAMEKRTQLQAMLRDVTKGCTVLVYKLDRLSRDVIEMVTIHRAIVKAGASVISLTDPYSDEFSVGLMGLIAQQARETIRVNTRNKLASKKKAGERYSGKIPYGYTIHPTHMVATKNRGQVVYKTGVLVPLESEQAILQRIYRYADMGVGYAGIAKILAGEGHLNREGKPFQKMSIYRLLNRRGHTKSADQSPEESECLTSHQRR